VIDDVADQVGGRFLVQLVDDAALVGADGLGAQVEVGRDLTGSLSCREGQEDIMFARRETQVPGISRCGCILRKRFAEIPSAGEHAVESLHQLRTAGVLRKGGRTRPFAAPAAKGICL
jgi:hypothetical protein